MSTDYAFQMANPMSSGVVNDEESNVEKERQLSRNETDEMIEKFREEREKKKQDSFWFVVKISWMLMATGIVGFFIDAALLYTSPGYTTLYSSFMSSIFMLVVGSGYLLFSTVPLDLLDIDNTVEKNYGMRVLLVSVGFTISLLYMVVSPFAHAMPVLISLTCLYPDDKISYFWNRLSFKVCMWFFSYSCSTAVMYAYWCHRSAYDRNISGQGLVEIDIPMGKPFYNMLLFLSIYYTMCTVIFVRIWYKRRQLYFTSNFEHGANPTMCVYLCMYLWNAIFGIGLLVNGIWLYVQSYSGESDEHDLVTFAGNCMGVGAALLIPPLVVAVFTREVIFNIMVRRFDNDSNNLQRDGAFIAALLDKVDIMVGQSWYVHRATPDILYDENDHHRYWRKGRVTEVCEKSKRMAISEYDDSGETIWINLGVTVDSDELLVLARKNLRCVEYETIISMELLTNGSVRDSSKESLYDLGRDVKKGEKIDFFISHSWHDPADIKVEKLKVLAEKFRQKYGRYPTFWLDKVCIDQNNIGSGLKVLPINVMACKRMLVLCGSTYSRRLWCVW